jgi:hypothetical protein
MLLPLLLHQMKRIIFILVLIQGLYLSDSHAQNFFPLPPGFDNEVRTLFYDTTTNVLYAGGNFDLLADWTLMPGISQWNGASWDTLGDGLHGLAFSIAKYGGYIYAGGSFIIKDSSGNYIYPANISYWDSAHWRLPPGNVFANDAVGTIFANGNDLYVGGFFDSIGGIYAQGIARYDGFQWHSYPTLDPNYLPVVSDIKIYNGELYVAGSFNGGFGLIGIVKYDGTNWVTVGGGLSNANSFVEKMMIYQGELYAVGYFFTAAGDPGNCIAKWNGTSWSSLGLGLNAGTQLHGITAFKNDIYVGGNFFTIAGVSSPFIAKWNGTNWSGLGALFNNGVACFASHGNDLYIGGGFKTVDNDTMNYITRYSPPLGIKENTWNTSGIIISSNPNNGNFSLTSLFYPIESIRLFDVSGSVVFSKEKILNSSYQCRLNAPDGIYIAEVFIKGNVYRNKILVMH